MYELFFTSSHHLVCCSTCAPDSTRATCLSNSLFIALLMALIEFIFFSSTLVPNVVSHFFLIEIFTSQRICPFSKSASEISLYQRVRCTSLRNSHTSSSEEKSGSVTISISGVPARLKSIIP